MNTLTDDLCYQALKTRDARFDGRFYTAVVTTGIFCRPICPAVTPKRGNVHFYPSAEAAMANGFRPCLRCRPEAAPGSPAAAGVHTTLARAVRLVEEGALDKGSVAELAERLGITDRYLRRLYKRHTGATPQQHAQARRLLRARQLIVDSNLSMTEIAAIAGFGSLRRFNHSLKTAYGDAPTAFRRGVRQPAAAKANRLPQDPFQPARDDLVLFLQARPPFDGDALLAFFHARAIPGLEAVGDRYYARAIHLQGHPGLVICRPLADKPGMQVILRGPVRHVILDISARVRRLFDLDADLPGITDHLSRDPLLRPVIERFPGLRVPGCWDRFEFAVRAILGQQISVAAARTLAGRVVTGYGAPLPEQLVAGTGITHRFPTPAEIAGQPLDHIGLTRSRTETLARVVARFAEPGFTELDGSTLLDQLAKLRGIGPWTLNYLALRGLGDPDAFPATDLGILKAAALIGAPDNAKALAHHAECWRPWRAYAAQYLWASLAAQPTLQETSS
ncbi:DNA-3-methyladenine glycosylase 2 family protein [Marinobacter sp. ATCH36]|uniref:DNA-3-methyladenine glycosylase 2 family protein n=1 Tax=Marinobacter sp. ATCH36 TaxID=2945106 RepID=UPI00202084AC|nr:DNA-3-methyladenine glycosylase 2 family protein [Marinobacter sp. ATCH36]MCL7942492.1 DNA-3-methyladenine glycosylase 2 family protein [Marinobacter sp. ATCH36]